MIQIFFKTKLLLNSLFFASLTLIFLTLLGGCETREDPCLLTANPSPSLSTTTSPTPIAKSPVMIILDASGSMVKEKEKIDGKLKLDIAKESITTIINSSDASNLELSLTALGHKSKDCKDNIEIFEEKNKKILDVLPAIKGGTETPLTEAIRQASSKFKDKKQKNIIVLLTDGVESCKKDKNHNPDQKAPLEEVDSLKKEGFNFILNIITLGKIKTNNEILEELAKAGGGKLYKPENTEELNKALSESVLRFGAIQVKRPKTATVASIKGWKLYENDNPVPIKHETKSIKTDFNLWEKNSVLAQNYRFCMYFEDAKKKPFIKDIQIESSQIMIVDYEKNRVEIKLNDAF
uniref:von Willebrand factor type A n=2 Tax=Gloeothece TaxID=28070 RepID=E0U8Y3_GLOV7|nr:von Willebrand factor type A [Gloeothece verrucosa PCC 7822]